MSRVFSTITGIAVVPLIMGSLISAAPETYPIEFLPLASRACAVVSPDQKFLVSAYVESATLSKVNHLQDAHRIPLNLSGRDKVTRLCFFKTLNQTKATTNDWVESFLETSPENLHALDNGKIIACRFEKWISRVGDKVLPLSLLYVSFQQKIPPTGTPLVNAQNKIIGIILQPAGGAAAYAIPAQAIHRVQNDIIAHHKLVRGWVGISLSTESNTPRITRIWPESPAQRANLRVDDILLRAGDYTTDHYPEAVNALFYTVPGKSTTIEVLRDGKRIPCKLTPVAQKP
ncbi:PDZ domain-containing protein [Luteolibacter algae]